MAAGSGSTDVIMINGGGDGVDVAIEGTIIHNHSMIIFTSLLHFCNDGLSGEQRQQLLNGAYAGVSGEWSDLICC